MFDVCLVMLIGLPGSGKTTLSQTLATFLENKDNDHKDLDNCKVVPVCYDSLLPASLDNNLQWKEARKNVLRDVQQLVNCLQKSEPENSIPPSQWTPVIKNILKRINIENGVQVVIIIDDNMYYRSMRYEYCQLARQRELGFCQIYIHCSLDEALKRNKSRDTAVPAAVITKMFNNIEPPNQKLHNWEKNSLVIPFSAITQPEGLASIVDLISKAIHDPMLAKQDLSKLCEESQITCSTTVLHQTDLALRRLVAKEISEAKQVGIKNSELRTKSAFLGEVRKRLLNDIRLGILVIPTDVIMAVEQQDSDAACELEAFLSNQYTLLINEQDSL